MTVLFLILNIGSFIFLLRRAYSGWTWFFKNYDDLPHILRSRYRYQKRFIFKRIWKRVKK